VQARDEVVRMLATAREERRRADAEATAHRERLDRDATARRTAIVAEVAKLERRRAALVAELAARAPEPEPRTSGSFHLDLRGQLDRLRGRLHRVTP
jgi:hypothetical protein